MKLTFICVGKTRERFVQEGVRKYLRYLGPYADVEIKEVKPEKIRDLKEAPGIRKKEAERIIKAIPDGCYLIGLDERGKEYTSHEFAAFLNGILDSGAREIVFIVGGAMGLDEHVASRSNKLVALSRWTFTHEMARLVLLEQLYRAFTIIKGKPYHY